MNRITGIVGLTDQINPTLPNLGAVKKGELAVNSQGATYPKKLDHFKFVPVGRIEGEVSPLEALFLEAYGPTPKTIYGMFIGNTEDSVLWTAMRKAGTNGKTMRLCNRQTCYSRTVQQGQEWLTERGEFECGWDAVKGECKFKCKAEGRLTFVLMTPDGSEPLFVNPSGFPIGTVSHKLAPTDIERVVGALRGAMLMSPLMGMVAKFSLTEWKHPKHGSIYATNFLFAGIYHHFQRPALAAPNGLLDVPEADGEDAFDDFGVDEGEVMETHTDVGTPPLTDAQRKFYAWAWDTYYLLPGEVDYLQSQLAAKSVDVFKVAAHDYITQPSKWNDETWLKACWYPFLEVAGVSLLDAKALVDTKVDPALDTLYNARQAVLQ